VGVTEAAEHAVPALGRGLGGHALGADPEELDDVGGPDERIGDDALVGEPDGGDGAAVHLGDERAPPEGAGGVECGKVPQGRLVRRAVGAEDHLVKLCVHGVWPPVLLVHFDFQRFNEWDDFIVRSTIQKIK
jgi:hypothetical protein